MPGEARWWGLVLGILFAAMAIDGLRTGAAWSRTGRDTLRPRQPVSFWLSIGCQTAMAVACLGCSVAAWTQARA